MLAHILSSGKIGEHASPYTDLGKSGRKRWPMYGCVYCMGMGVGKGMGCGVWTLRARCAGWTLGGGCGWATRSARSDAGAGFNVHSVYVYKHMFINIS